MKILIKYTGNRFRSQMDGAYLTSYCNKLNIHNAGTSPANEMHPKAIHVLAEEEIDIRSHQDKLVGEFLKDTFSYVIMVYRDAKENFPVFSGNVKERIHVEFEDTATATGTEEEILPEFRRKRDNNKEGFNSLFNEILQNEWLQTEKDSPF
jgi:arsenate reductase (thioredoxin)